MNRQGRILVVDDLETWREELTEILQRGGFYVESASTVTEVLQRLNETFYHLLVLDIRLDEADQSNKNGIDLLGELDKQGMSESIKVIMLSARDTKEHIRTAFRDYRVIDFLSKDEFTKQAFLENVRHIFAKEE